MTDEKEKDGKYWMGVVDTRLGNVEGAVKTLVDESRSNWADFRSYRLLVESRLTQGSERFMNHDRRLNRLENSKESHKDDKEEKFVTWPWVRDKLLVPVIVSLLITSIPVVLVLAYLLSNGYIIQ